MKQKQLLDPPGWHRIPGDRVLHRYCTGTVVVLTGNAYCLRCQARWRQRNAEAVWVPEREEVG